jgi:hypothetical protein
VTQPPVKALSPLLAKVSGPEVDRQTKGTGLLRARLLKG